MRDSVHRGRGSLYDVTSCLPDWSYVPSRGSLSLVPCSFQGGLCMVRGRDISVQGGLWGSLCSWGSLSEGVSVRENPQTETPQYGDERVVRILLECFVVVHIDSNGLRSPFKINFKNAWKFANKLGKILETSQVKKVGVLK